MPRKPVHVDFEPLLTLAETAAFFGVTPGRVQVWDRAGKLAEAVIRTPSGQRRFRESVILALRREAEGRHG